MYYKAIRSDVLKTKLITLTTTLFITAAAALVSLAAILVVYLSGAIDTLMIEAKAPHFMQMHSGDIDEERLSAFAKQTPYVDDFQILEFLNIDGAQFVFGNNSLINNLQDNGLCVQSGSFDYLLDLAGNIIHVSDGEVYVPICYMRDNTTRVGEKAIIYGKEFTVAGFLRDSTMNSTLSSSKRFLISAGDYKEVRSLGSPEYLIEFRLTDLSQLSAFQAAYTAADLEANGPTLTFRLFKMLSAISDGMLIGVILLVSALVVAMALMCIRFTLLAQIEDDYREIGVMKALGLRVSAIKKIYQAKYAVVSVVGSILGFALALTFRGTLVANIRLYIGESQTSSLAFVLGVFSVVVVLITFNLYVKGLLNRFRYISAVEAIRYGAPQEKKGGARYFPLSKSRILNTNLFLGVRDVLGRKRIYFTMLMVLVISSFIIIVPQNLYSTISRRGFSTYMGIGSYDLRFDIQQANIEKANEVMQALKDDNAISQATLLTTRVFRAKTASIPEFIIRIELGDHTAFPVQYSKGRAPIEQDEIALSVINADELGLNIGDTFIVEDRLLTISGIYSDITNGGKTAKAAFTDSTADIMYCVIGAKLLDTTMVIAKANEYKDMFSFAKVSNVDDYISQTFGSTISSVGKASFVALLVSLCITTMVTLLFMKLLAVKDRYSIAVMKSLGFTSSDITAQYVARSIFVLFIGVLFGTLLANTVGEMLAGMIISLFGASSFKFEVNYLWSYLFSPLMMVLSVLIATYLGTASAGNINISGQIRE